MGLVVPPWFPIMSDLRTAIAAAIDQRYNDEAIGHTYEVCLHAADAVIAALDLRIDDKHRSASGEQQYVGVSGFFAVKEG